MLFENKTKEMVLRSYLEAKANDEKQRKAEASRRLSIYHECWKDEIKKALYLQHDPESGIYDIIKNSADDTQNLLKKVINEISVLYKTSPVRSFSDEVNYYDGIEIDRTMKTVNRYFNLVNDVGVMMLYYEDEQKVNPMILTPAVTSVVQNDKNLSKIDAMWYEIEKGDTAGDHKKLYVYWDDESHYMFDDDLKIYPVDGNEEMRNPYGYIPVVWFHRDQPPGLFWNRSGNETLVSGAIWNAILKSWKKYYMKVCAVSQPWASGPLGDFDRKKAKWPGYLWAMPPGSTLGKINYDMNFEAYDAAIDKDADDVLGQYGLSVSMFSLGPEQMSGKALQIKNRGLADIRVDQEPIFRKCEKMMFDIFRDVSNYHGVLKIPDSVEMTIDYAEIDSFMSDAERKEADWLDVKRGAMSLVEYYMKRNPDADRDKASEKIEENIEMLKKLQGTGLSLDDLFKDGGSGSDQEGFNEI